MVTCVYMDKGEERGLREGMHREEREFARAYIVTYQRHFLSTNVRILGNAFSGLNIHVDAAPLGEEKVVM